MCSPKPLSSGVQPVSFNEDVVIQFYEALYSDVNIDREESLEVQEFFARTVRPDPNDVNALIQLRATAFKVGSNHISTENPDKNDQLLRCINACFRANVLHATSNCSRGGSRHGRL
jgi:hypothetical protein